MNDGSFFIFLGTGFLAQLLGSTLGMGYGTLSTAVLLSMGMSPALTSASVNNASIFTAGVSGWMHWREGNVDKKTFLSLAVPGALGALIGAVVLSETPASIIKPIMAVYMLVLAAQILLRSVRISEFQLLPIRRIVPIGLIGGFLAACCGGGWGPLVNGYLVSKGHSPKDSIGASNAAKFFTTLAASLGFALLFREVSYPAVLGLALGGLVATPLSTLSTKRSAPRLLMASMAALLMFLGVRTLDQTKGSGVLPNIELSGLWQQTVR